MPGLPHSPNGSIASTISTAAVRLLNEYTGRGPTKAKTTLNGDLVVIVLADQLTRGERTLVADGQGDFVLSMRHRFQMTMREDLVAAVEASTERKVIAFMSDSHIDPDMAAEVFILEPRIEPDEMPPASSQPV